MTAVLAFWAIVAFILAVAAWLDEALDAKANLPASASRVGRRASRVGANAAGRTG